MSQFSSPYSKLTIASLEPEAADLVVEAQYNPKELQIEKAVPWMEHQGMQLEYGGIKSRSMTIEMLFDGYEQGASIDDRVAKLERLSSPRDESSRREAMRRPHRCVVVWGDRGMPRLRCVIESLVTKYVMWDREGTPVRAICTVKVKEVKTDAAEARAEGRQLNAARSAAQRRRDAER
jgi:hypothetical protein